MKVKSESEVAWSCRTLGDPWTAAYQAPPSMDFPGKSTVVGCHCLLQISSIINVYSSLLLFYSYNTLLLKEVGVVVFNIKILFFLIFIFFIFSFIFISWRLITLQYSVVFAIH